MTRAVELLAVADMAAAKKWYRQRHPHLEGDSFCVDETQARIARHPIDYARPKGTFRQAFVHRFPYRVVFRMVVDLIVVVAIFHTSRHPRTLIARLEH